MCHDLAGKLCEPAVLAAQSSGRTQGAFYQVGMVAGILFDMFFT